MTAVIEQQWSCAKCATVNEPWRQFCGQCGVQPPMGHTAVFATPAAAPLVDTPKKRRRWPKVLAVVVVLAVAAGTVGVAYLRQTDPAAARDRSAALAALPTVGDLGPEWSIDDESSYAASRAGLREVDPAFVTTADCLGVADPTVEQGTGGAHRALTSETGYVSVAVMFVEDAAAGAQLMEITRRPEFSDCLATELRAGALEGASSASDVGLELQPLPPPPPPAAGEAAASFRFTGRFTGEAQPALDVVFDMSFVQQGRAVVVGVFFGLAGPLAPELQSSLLRDVVSEVRLQQ